MARPSDDDVIVDGDAEGRRDIDDLAGHLDIGPGGRGIAGGMVVDHPSIPIMLLIFIKSYEGMLKVVPVFGACASCAIVIVTGDHQRAWLIQVRHDNTLRPFCFTIQAQ